MFVIADRYLIIDTSTGYVTDRFDDGQEDKIKKHIEQMQKEGCPMHHFFIVDKNHSFAPMPVLMWAMHA